MFLNGQGGGFLLTSVLGALRPGSELRPGICESSSTERKESGSYEGRWRYSRAIPKESNAVRTESKTWRRTRRIREGPAAGSSVPATAGGGASGVWSRYLAGIRRVRVGRPLASVGAGAAAAGGDDDMISSSRELAGSMICMGKVGPGSDPPDKPAVTAGCEELEDVEAYDSISVIWETRRSEMIHSLLPYQRTTAHLFSVSWLAALRSMQVGGDHELGVTVADVGVHVADRSGNVCGATSAPWIFQKSDHMGIHTVTGTKKSWLRDRERIPLVGSVYISSS